ncbi:MAG: endonuclease MutS2, partial [Bradymonadaceae bacterium]
KASPDIKRLRQAVQNQHDRLKAKIDELLRSQELDEHLQEDYYTMREDRYVLPVRVGSKNQVPGIVHGYSSSGKTAFIEPRELVEINNQLRWAEIELEEEKNRVLERLSGLVTEYADALERNADLLAYLDVVAAAAEFGYETIDGSIPVLSDNRLALTEVRHPLLWVQHQREVDGETLNDTVTNDVHIDPDKEVLVVSGPNTGGKTVLLKAMGLCALMTRCGLP